MEEGGTDERGREEEGTIAISAGRGGGRNHRRGMKG